MFETLMILLALAQPAPVPTPQTLPHLLLRAPEARIDVQVARTQAQLERGLMGVTHLAAHTGMLFVFRSDGPEAFWMKDTLIPLDMVFIGADGNVRKIYANVPVAPLTQPDDEIPREVGTGKYVLELPAGEARLDGLRPGVPLRGLPR